MDLQDESGQLSVATERIKIVFDKNTTLMKVVNLENGKVVIEEVEPIVFEKDMVTLKLKEQSDEYFYGGGVQNGRFSHKGRFIAIENQNSWTDGGVASQILFIGRQTVMASCGIRLKKEFMISDVK